jgi:hypothetical protein
MDPSSNIDDAVLESVLRLSLEEAEAAHKPRVGASEQYALSLQAAELETALRSFRDARLARNIADAVNEDDVQQLVQVEQTQVERSENPADTMGSMGSTPTFDTDLDLDVDTDRLPTVESPGRQTPELSEQEM